MVKILFRTLLIILRGVFLRRRVIVFVGGVFFRVTFFPCPFHAQLLLLLFMAATDFLLKCLLLLLV